MNKNICGITAAISLTLAGCGDTDSNALHVAAGSSDFKGYAMRGADNSWPPLAGDSNTVSSNLMTKNYYIVLDGSGSMGDSSCSNGVTRLNAAQQAVNSFINNVPADADIGLLVFDGQGIGERVGLNNSNREQVIRQVNNSRAGGGTPLKSAVKAGYKALTQKAQQQLGYGEYHLVVVTDGEASGGENPSRAVSKLLNQSPITLHTIGFCINGNHSLNQKGLTIYKNAKNPQALSEGLNDVLAESPSFSVDAFQEG